MGRGLCGRERIPVGTFGHVAAIARRSLGDPRSALASAAGRLTFSKSSSSARPRPVTVPRSYHNDDVAMRDGCLEAPLFGRTVRIVCPHIVVEANIYTTVCVLHRILHNRSRFGFCPPLP